HNNGTCRSTKAFVIFPQYDSKGALVTDPKLYPKEVKKIALTGKVDKFAREHNLAAVKLDDPSHIPPQAKAAQLAPGEPRPGNKVHMVSSPAWIKWEVWSRVPSPPAGPSAWRHGTGTVKEITPVCVAYEPTMRQDVRYRSIKTTLEGLPGN